MDGKVSSHATVCVLRVRSPEAKAGTATGRGRGVEVWKEVLWRRVLRGQHTDSCHVLCMEIAIDTQETHRRHIGDKASDGSLRAQTPLWE
jgi:hypothetical protein